MLPKLPDVVCSIYVREGGDREALEQLADALAEILQAQRSTAQYPEDALVPTEPSGEMEASLGLRASGG